MITSPWNNRWRRVASSKTGSIWTFAMWAFPPQDVGIIRVFCAVLTDFRPDGEQRRSRLGVDRLHSVAALPSCCRAGQAPQKRGYPWTRSRVRAGGLSPPPDRLEPAVIAIGRCL